MSGDTIKSFLVGLGFGVDDASLAKFNKAIASATLKVTALYASTKIAAAGILYGISKISEGFEQMGYEYRLIVPAINKALILRQELLKAYSAAGINITKVVQASVKLNMSLAKTRFAFEAIYRSVASKFFDLITKQSDIFRQKIYANMPKIQRVLENTVKFIFKALEATITLGTRLWSILGRVYDFFVALDRATDGWSTKLVAVIAAWKLLNLSFLATPLGLLITGLVALLALWDDFKTFKEGGESLINWGSRATQTFVGVAAAIAAVAAAFYAITLAMKAYAIIQGIVNALLLISPFGLIIAGVTALIALVGLLIYKWTYLREKFANFFSGIGGKILDFVGGSNNLATNLENSAGSQPGVPRATPVGSQVANSQTNQNVNQQTSINVQGSADANAIGKAVAGEQGRVNFDMVRNMKGATR